MAENNGVTNGTNGTTTVNPGNTGREGDWWDKIKVYLSYISVEPLMVCWLVPACFLLVAVQNLELDKVSK